MQVQRKHQIPSARAIVLAALATASLAGMAQAQNLLKNGSFESLDFSDIDLNPSGTYTFPGPDIRHILNWSIPAGRDVDVYTPGLFAPNPIARVPHCRNLIRLDNGTPAFSTGAIQQTFNTCYATASVQFYACVADLAGDRGGVPPPASAQLWTNLQFGAPNFVTTTVPTTPDPGGNNTTANSIFEPRVIQHNTHSASMSGTFEMFVPDLDPGMLVDAVHLFPVHAETALCGDYRTLAGFSILEDGTWSFSTICDPWQDLRYSTPAATCGCGQRDFKAITMHSGCGEASTMIVAAWDQNPGSTRTTLEFTIEANAVGTSYRPQFSVKFYDWVAHKWVTSTGQTGSQGWINPPPFMGAKLTSAPACYTVDFDQYVASGRFPPLSNFVNSTSGLVLAKVQFANGCGQSDCAANWSPPPRQPWTIDVHYVNIDCK